MPMTAKQHAENQAQYDAAMANSVVAKITGKVIGKNGQSGEWEPVGDAENNSHKKLQWGWLGHTYMPNADGLLCRLKGFKPKQKASEKDEPIFDRPGIPKAALEFWKRKMQLENVNDRFEVVEQTDEAADDNQGDKSIDKMDHAELVELGISKGLKAEDLEPMKLKALRELLKG